jgi:hypothetical protein
LHLFTFPYNWHRFKQSKSGCKWLLEVASFLAAQLSGLIADDLDMNKPSSYLKEISSTAKQLRYSQAARKQRKTPAL